MLAIVVLVTADAAAETIVGTDLEAAVDIVVVLPAMAPTYVKHERVSLKGHATFSERWLQKQIAEDPEILGLGDLVLLERERRQEAGGRLDLLLADPEQDRRFEVELMLGPTDESHIIRSIEYWDIERRRYPGYDHCAVLVAEDITSRFLNVLSLLAGTIPFVAIQLNALQVHEHILLDFVKVLDQRLLRRDDGIEPNLVSTDRAYWESRSTPKMVQLVDRLFEIINEKAEPKQQPNYNKFYIGLTDGAQTRATILFKPMKKFVHVLMRVSNLESWLARLDETGLTSGDDRGRLRVTIVQKDVQQHNDLLVELLHQAVNENLG